MLSPTKLFIALFICSGVFSSSEPAAHTVSTTKDYIDFRLKEAKERLARIYAENANENTTSSGQIDWVQLWSEIPTTRRPRAVGLPHRMFIVDGKRVFSIDSNPIVHGDTRLVSELDIASTRDNVNFVKRYLWIGSVFLLVCESDSCAIYQGTDISRLSRRDTIRYKDMSPVDACFFARDDQLHLVVSYRSNDGRTYAPTVVYQWTGEKMNSIAEVLTPAARAISTIKDDSSTMLLFALEDNLIDAAVDVNIGCVVYELKSGNEVEFFTYLPNVGSVTGIYPYSYDGEEFALLTSDEGLSGIFLWDGTDLQKWISVPSIEASSLISVVQAKNHTLLFVCNADAVHIYRLENRQCTHLDSLRLSGVQRVVEIGVWEYENSIMLVIIKLNPDGTYPIELWQLTFHEEQTESATSQDVWNCFNELKVLLDNRMPYIENATRTWSKLAAANKNTTELFFDEENMPLIEFDTEDASNVSSPIDINANLIKLQNTVAAVLEKSKNVASGDVASLSGTLTVDGDAIIENLHMDSLNVEYLNDEKLNLNDFFISESDQSFAVPLEAATINIDNLEVSSLCGLDSAHWLQINDTRRTRLDDIIDRSMIYNDTISLDRDVALNELNAQFINDVNITHFLEDVFVIGKNQVIKGNVTYRGLAQVSRLTADTVNDVSSSSLITRYTNQSLGDVFIETLRVTDLYVEKINGVPVDRAARMSQENVIKGKVTIGTLRVTKELTIKNDTYLPLNRSIQVYDEIVINGDLYIKNLEIEDNATLAIGNNISSSHNIHDLIENSWSRSSNQTIKKPISLLKGASIDELSFEYLNGIGKDDFLYVTDRELNDLENVTFSNFHFENVVNEDTQLVEKFYEESSDLLTFHKTVRFSHLSVDNLIADTYNGIPIDTLMQSNGTLNFSGVSEFEVVRVNGQMSVDDLRVKQINDRDVFPIHEALMVDQELIIDTLKSNELNTINLEVKNLNGHDLEDGLLAQKSFVNRTNNISLTIDGEIEIEDGIQVQRINNQEPSEYISGLKELNPEDLIHMKSIKNLHVLENLNVTLLNGKDISEIFDSALSKDGNQMISGEFEVLDATVKNLKTQMINNKNMSRLMYIDEPCTFRGNVSFSRLEVRGNVTSKTLKGKLISEIQQEQRVIPMNEKISLHVFGSVTWDKSSSKSDSISYLLNNAVTRDEDQVIDCSVTFQKPVAIESLYLPNDNSSFLKKIRSIVDDAVVDSPNGNPIFVSGSKIFKKGLVVSDLEVTNNIDVNYINDLDVVVVASQIFQKYKNHTVSGHLTFLEEVKIGNLITSNKIHGVSVSELATKDTEMPENMRFDHLIVQGNVSLHTLDGVDFDQFKKQRIDIRKDHEIYGDVQFEESVVVTNQTFVSTINGIKPTDLVENDPSGAPILISGNKIFTSEVLILDDMQVNFINNISINEMFEDSVLVDQNTTINGSLIFENDVEIQGNIEVSGSINNLKPDKLIEGHLLETKLAASQLIKEVTSIEKSILKSENSLVPTKQLLYLEKDESLKIQLPGVYNVKTTETESAVRLDIYAKEFADFCGLPDDCFCRRQYVVDIFSMDNYTIHEDNNTAITFSIYESNRLFGFKIVTAGVSNSERCSKKLSEPESTKMFWITIENGVEQQSENPLLETSGFVADTQAFLINDRLYLMLAIFYNKETNSHATDSLIYEVDLQSRKIIAIQPVATEGARALHIFQIVNVGIYALVGCVKGKAESLLFRFNPETQQFQLVRSFSTGGSRHVGSVSGSDDNSFVILNNPDIEALQIFAYDRASDDFYLYQNLYFESRVTSLNVFYAGAIGSSDAFVTATTRDGSLYVYEYMFIGKFQLKLSHWESDIQALSPFRYMNRNYLFAGLKYNSTVYRFIEQGLD